MTRFRLRYTHEFIDRTGLRRYVRPPGAKHATPLPGAPGSADFMNAYHGALAAAARPAEIGAARTHGGSVSTAIVGYYRDVAFLALAPGTRKMRRAILEQFRAGYGDRQIAGLQRVHIVNLLGSKKPFAARNWLKALRGLMQFLVATEQRLDDATAGIKLPKARPGEIHSWTEAEIKQYEARHLVGTRARLALALLLFTAQRRSDVVIMGRQHIQGGAVIVRQRPGTAKGFVFLSMEDESGIMNAIVTPPLFDRNRLVLLAEPYLLIDGVLQNVDNVVSVKADRIQALEARAAAKSHDFH